VILRNYLGLDLRPDQLLGVALRRRGSKAVLSGHRIQSLAAGIVVPSVREPIIRDARRFSEALRQTLAPLAGGEDRIALSLPEGSGRVLLTEVETPFKSKDEGVEVLKWQLKGHFPVDPKDLHLDYQVLERRENGRLRLVVAFLARGVLVQLEDLFAAAGFNPALIDFHTLNVFNYYQGRQELGEDFVLVGFEGGSFSLQYYQNRLLAFHRSRDLEGQAEAVFQEINRTLAGCRESYPGLTRSPVFLHCIGDCCADVRDALHSLFDRDITILEPHLERMMPLPLVFKSGQDKALVAAIGVAERLL
jgi:type IV pilus assembly protein PilM